jgi:hypothetical protein
MCYDSSYDSFQSLHIVLYILFHHLSVLRLVGRLP